MALKEFCPACQKIVEYQLSEGDYYCSICGRTKKVAEEKIKHDKKYANAKKLKIILKTIGIIIFLVLILWGWSVDSEGMSKASARGIGMAVLALVVSILASVFYGIKAIARKAKKRQHTK